MVVVGGLGDVMPIDDFLRNLVIPLREASAAKASEAGWNGIFEIFEPIAYAKQTVAGTNYFVKIQVGENKFVHVRVYEPLPHTNLPAEVHSVLVDRTKDEAIEYF